MTSRWGESSLLLGVTAFATFLILGVTSLPSVAASLSWKEWNFIQSTVGYVALAMATAHGVLYSVTFECTDIASGCNNFPRVNIQATLDKWPGKVPPSKKFS